MIPLSYKRVASTVSLDLPDMHAHADRDSSAKSCSVEEALFLEIGKSVWKSH